MGRKQRLKERDEKRKERQESNFKKNSYHKMAEDGKLGYQDLGRYTCMYESLKKEKRNGFKHPEENPNRIDYNKLKRFYYSSTSSLDRICY